jgi:hypothetical protein
VNLDKKPHIATTITRSVHLIEISWLIAHGVPAASLFP